METNCLCGNYVHKRTALQSGEYSLVDRLCKLFLAENESASRSAESLMCRRRYYIGIGDGVHVQTSRNETCNMRHIDHEVCADFLGNLRDLLEIYRSCICTCAGYDELGLALESCFSHVVIIYLLGALCYAIGNEVIILT